MDDEQVRVGHQDGQSAGSRHGDVEAVARVQELEVARRVVGRRRGCRVDRHGRLLALELVDRAHSPGHADPALDGPVDLGDLGVVRRHDDDVVEGQRPGGALAVRPGAAEERGDQPGHGLGLLTGPRRPSAVVDRPEPDARPLDDGSRPDRLPGIGGIRHDPVLVERLRHESVHRRMHPVGPGQEEAAVGRQRAMVPDEVLESRALGTHGMDPRADLRELVRVAEEDDRARRATHGHDVGQRHLAGLVDEQDVDLALHLVTGEQPRCPGRDVDRTIHQGALDRGVVGRELDSVEVRRVVARIAFLDRPQRQPCLGRCLGGRDQQVGDRLVGRGTDPNPATGLDCLHDHARPQPGLARARWALDREDRPIEVEDDAASRLEGRFAVADQLAPRGVARDPRRHSEDQVADRSIRPIALDAGLDGPVRDPAQGVAHHARIDWPAAQERARMRAIVQALPQEVHMAVVEVHGMDPHTAARVVLPAGARAVQLVVLGREGVAMDDGLLLGAHDADVGQVADRLGLVDELLGAQLAQPEVVPPGRLVAAPVPVEELGQEPSAGLLGRPLGRIDRHVSGQGSDPPERLGLGRGDGLGGLPGDGLRATEEDPELRLGFATEPLQPAVQAPGRETVIPVVRGDRGEDLRVAGLQPALVLDHAEPCRGDDTLALGHVELLDLLDRVRLDRRLERLADDPVQVDQDVAAQDPIDLVLPCAVAAHQALEGRRLVRRVVVDVHGRLAREPLDDEVDERLEHGLLLGRVVCPERMEHALAGDLLDPAEEVLDAAVHGPWVGLDVEEDVERRPLRQGRQTTVRLLAQRQQLAAQAARAPPFELDPGLIVEPGVGPRVDVPDRQLGWRVAERGQRRQLGRDQPLRG